MENDEFAWRTRLAREAADGVGKTASEKQARDAAWAAADADPNRRYWTAEEASAWLKGRRS